MLASMRVGALVLLCTLAAGLILLIDPPEEWFALNAWATFAGILLFGLLLFRVAEFARKIDHGEE